MIMQGNGYHGFCFAGLSAKSETFPEHTHRQRAKKLSAWDRTVPVEVLPTAPSVKSWQRLMPRLGVISVGCRRVSAAPLHIDLNSGSAGGYVKGW